MTFTVERLCAGYGDALVLFGVDLTLEAGQVSALMGRNGMGKTTLLKALMGLLPATGRVDLDGKMLVGLRPYEIARHGVGYVPQGREIFGGLSVEENLMLGVLGHRGLDAAIPARLVELFPMLDERRSQQASSLSGGEQQQLAIARALMGRPRVLLLDEPSEGVQPSIVQLIGHAIERIAREDNVAVLLVEQSLDLALSSATVVHFLEAGRIAASSTPAELDDDPTLVDRFLGL